MRKFLLTYWMGIALFFGIFYWDASPLSFIINHHQTNFTIYLTSLTLPQEMMTNAHINITEHYSLVIEKACNGMIPYLFFLASIVAFPSNIFHTVKWAILGYFIISMVNTFRIWFVTKMVMEEQHNFSLAHDYIGNALLIITGLLLFVAFVKTRTIETIKSKLHSEKFVMAQA